MRLVSFGLLRLFAIVAARPALLFVWSAVHDLAIGVPLGRGEVMNALGRPLFAHSFRQAGERLPGRGALCAHGAPLMSGRMYGCCAAYA